MRCWIAVLLLLASASAQAEGWRLVNENLVTSDSDDAEQRAYFLGALGTLPGLGGNGGLWLGRWEFDEKDVGSEDFDALRLSYEREITDRTWISARLQSLHGDDWSPTLGMLTAVHKPAGDWRFEASAERGWIDSVSGLRQKLNTDTYSISADWRFAEQWTLVAALIDMSIDDGNNREGGVLRLIYDVPAVSGLTLQTRSKRLDSDFDGVGYFSPPELEEHLLLAGYARPVFDERWVFSILAGAGSQRFETDFGDTVRNDLYYLELGARGWFNDRFGLEGKGYCSNTGGPNLGTPDDSYRYCNLLFSFIGAF